MLFESVIYQDNLPFEISFLNVAGENKHCHKEIEILMVLRGVTHYQIYHMDYELNPGDLIIADVEDLHQIHDSSDDVLMLSIHVDTKRFENIYPDIRYMFFVCEECMEGPSSNRQILRSKLALLKHRIARLAFDWISGERNLLQLTEGINDLVSILVNHFQGFFMEDYQYKTGQENLNSVDLQRLSGITRYILLNYNKKITLDDVSKMEHLSSYYVSHLIKKTLGFNFQNFVNAIRLEFAEKLLVFSNLTLMQISEECGFSSPNYFNKCFSAWHGKTPAQYRKEYHPCERTYKGAFTQEEALSLLAPYLNLTSTADDSRENVANHITVNMDFKQGVFIDFWEHYAPQILISSLEDVMRLGYYEGKLKNVRPAAFLLEESVLKHQKERKSVADILAHFSIPLKNLEQQIMRTSTPLNASAAFQQIFTTEVAKIFAFGEGNALFTEEGLATPLYYAYECFAQWKEPQVCVNKNDILVKSQDSWGVVLYNTSPYSVLHAQLQTEGLPERFFLMKTELSEKDNCYAVLKDLGQPTTIPEILKRRLDMVDHGRTHFSLVDKTESPSLDFLVYHNTLTMLEIIKLD